MLYVGAGAVGWGGGGRAGAEEAEGGDETVAYGVGGVGGGGVCVWGGEGLEQGVVGGGWSVQLIPCTLFWRKYESKHA